MSEFINENPNILDEAQLPQRAEDVQDWSGLALSKPAQERQKQLLQLTVRDTQLVKDVALLDTLLTQAAPPLSYSDSESDSDEAEPVDPQEIYDLIAHISDPEHPLTLGQLAVVNLPDIDVRDSGNPHEIAEVVVRITPTITHCSLATLIGLGIRVRLERSLTPRFRITVLLKKGSHQSENQVNKQLNDKERVAAACENEQLVEVVSKMLSTCK
ncbi:AaceriAGR343Wp [[Ashbya] aceris (nom. inval.)]|nr:AaceriAGR343Wp [[Ashbya] aceris (nom. inval.)]